MNDWQRLRQDAWDTALSFAHAGDTMSLFAGGWYVWFGANVRTLKEGSWADLECEAASLLPEPASDLQLEQMASLGWTLDDDNGFMQEHSLPIGDVPQWVAELGVETLRTGLGVPAQDMRAGLGRIWPDPPREPPPREPTEAERSEVEDFLAQVQQASARRKADEERQRPHRQASEVLYRRAMQQRDRYRALQEASRKADDLDGLLLHNALDDMTTAAFRAAQLRAYDPRVQQPTEALLTLVEKGQLEGAWQKLDELFDASEKARHRRDEYMEGLRAAREREIQLVEFSRVEPPVGPGQDVDRRHHHIVITALVLAGPTEQLIEALQFGAVTGKDVEYSLAGVPTTRGSKIGAGRRGLIKLARQYAAVEARDGGTYLPPTAGAQ